MAARFDAFWWKDMSAGQLRTLLQDIPDEYRVHAGTATGNIVIRGTEKDGFRYLGQIDILSEQVEWDSLEDRADDESR